MTYMMKIDLFHDFDDFQVNTLQDYLGFVFFVVGFFSYDFNS